MTKIKTSVVALIAASMGTPALPATMINLEFEADGLLVPSLPATNVRRDEFGSDTDYLQIREKRTFTPGLFQALVKPTLEAEFSDFMSLSAAGGARVSLNVAELTSFHRSTAQATYLTTAHYRWNPVKGLIAGGSLNTTVLDQVESVSATGIADRSSFNFGQGPIEAANFSETSVVLPAPTKAPVGVSPKIGGTTALILDSDLTLSGMNGSLLATNQSTGTVKSVDFLLKDGALDLDLNLDEVGTWDLELTNLGLDNTIKSSLTAAVSYFQGFAIEFPGADLFGEGCGDPRIDVNNKSLCAFDIAKSTTETVSLYSNKYSTADFFLRDAIGSFGSITVTADATGVSPVPLPAGLPLYLAGLGGLALIRRKRKLGACDILG